MNLSEQKCVSNKNILKKWRLNHVPGVILKKNNHFHNKYRDCKQCNIIGSLKRYYENKDKLSNRQKFFYGNKRNKVLQKQNDRYLHFKKLLINYADLGNRLKASEKISYTTDRKVNRCILICKWHF